MPNYQFTQFQTTIVDPVVDVVYAGFDLKTGNTDVSIVLESGGNKFGITLSDISQPTEWTTEAVGVWVSEQLNKYISI